MQNITWACFRNVCTEVAAAATPGFLEDHTVGLNGSKTQNKRVSGLKRLTVHISRFVNDDGLVNASCWKSTFATISVLVLDVTLMNA